MKTISTFFLFNCFIFLALCEYIPPGPFYRCPKEKLLIHPCSCDSESDNGITVSCNNTNLASASIALNNLATFRIPIEKLTFHKCNIARLYGSLLYKLNLKVLYIEKTPIELIEDYTFLGVNSTLNEIYLIDSKLKQFPTLAFKILGNITILTIDGHEMTELPKDAFVTSDMTGTLLRLQISNGNIISLLPESLQPLRKLKYLDLHGNQLSEMKRNQFKGLRDLEFLDISYNNLTKVEGIHLADITKLSFFNVSNNRITEISRGAFARNTVLKLVNMASNKIRKLDQNSFRGMRFLRRLFLADNVIADVGRDTFGSLKRIGTIDLARNLLKKIDYQMFYDLNYVDLLDVSSNQITEIQKNAFKGLYTTKMDLSKNKISKIENGAFENCANMSLDLSYNQIANIPSKAFDETSYAVEFQLSFNLLSNFSQVPLHNMTGLKILNVSNNLITTIPKKSFPKLYELHTIDLSHNKLIDVFNSVFQTLFSLRSLNMSYNDLETIKPSVFGTLPTLLELDLSYNKLESVSRSAFTRLASTRTLTLRGNSLKTLFQLPISVSHLDLSYNDFDELPPKLWPSMNSLLSLDLSHNNLRDTLGEGSFAGLLTVQKLNLNYNGITKPPWVPITDLSSLQYLYLEGNNITTIGRNAFGKLPTTFELNLAYNNINNISTRAFEGLLQVIVVNLTHNNLTHIPNGAFQGLVALRELDLSHNRISKLDNKTHGVLDDCLSIEKVDLSHNKISFLSRKMFPSNRYIPYKLKEINLSYNLMPVLTSDLTVGTGKAEILNISHNAISDIRKGVIGNLTRLKVLDLSFNKLYDLTSDKDFFKLPENLTDLYLNENVLSELPWGHLTKASHLDLLDIRDNNFEEFPSELTDLVKRGTDVYFEGNKLRCDCLLRPIFRHFQSQLELKSLYKKIKCAGPPFVENRTLYSLSEERLNCPQNVITDQLKERQPGDYEILTDLKFRELAKIKGIVKVKWRVMKQSDIADTEVIIRKLQNPEIIAFQKTVPYFQRALEIDPSKDFNPRYDKKASYQICILAKDSKNRIKSFHKDQCQDLSKTISSASTNFVEKCIVFIISMYYLLNIIL